MVQMTQVHVNLNFTGKDLNRDVQTAQTSQGKKSKPESQGENGHRSGVGPPGPRLLSESETWRIPLEGHRVAGE